jgi:hypothetical protein
MLNVESFPVLQQTLQLSSSIGSFRKPYTEHAAGGGWDMKDLIGRTEEWAATQLVINMWLRKRGDEKSFSFLLTSCKKCIEKIINFYSYEW